MSDVVATSDSAWILFLFSFAVSVLLISQRLIQIALRKRVPVQQEWLNTGFSIVVVAVLAVDAATSLQFDDQPTLDYLLQVGIVLLTVLVSWLFMRITSRGQLASGEWRIPSLMILLIASVSSAAWSAHRFYSSISPQMLTDFPYQQTPGRSEPSTRFVGVTDRGREFDLLCWKPRTERDMELIKSMMEVVLETQTSTIARGEEDVRSNCHGWVFTGGRFLLNGEGVARILEDNGYEAVEEPRAGDVVIYRVGDGEISHTGLVQGVLGDGTVIVESKWSIGGRYLHRPEDQPYSNVYTYYRTARENHIVSIRYKLPAAKKPVLASDRSEEDLPAVTVGG